MYKFTTFCSEDRNYGTDSGFYLIQLQKVLSVVQHFVDGLMHIGQRRVLLGLFERLFQLRVSSVRDSSLSVLTSTLR